MADREDGCLREIGFPGGGFITDAAPILIVIIGFGKTFLIILASLIFFLVLSLLSGWWHCPQKEGNIITSWNPVTFRNKKS